MFKMTESRKQTLNTGQSVRDILGTIEREREREIISRRFGLFERKETLEQIGELLDISRERGRELEKTVLTRLKMSAGQGELPHISEVQTQFVAELSKTGNGARISELATRLGVTDDRIEQARVAFLAQLCPELTVVDEDDNYYLAACLTKVYDLRSLKAAVAKLVDAIKEFDEPVTIDRVATAAGIVDATQATALASISKHLPKLNGFWRLVRWPTVNPNN